MRNLFIALGMSALTFSGLAQNNCNSAVTLDPVPADALCPGTPNGSFTTPLSVTLGDVAGPSNPYTYVPDCDNTPGNDMELFANDLWFSFTATANILNVDLTNISGLSEANVGFYTGTCAQLIGLGCSVSGANPSTFSATLEPLTPGDTYYIQVSGGATDPTTGSFDIAIANSLDCNDCLTGATLTVNPAPIAGTYQPGQVVDFCFTVTDYTQVSANWFHGVEIQLGSGWDQTIGTDGIVSTAIPASCSGSGVWGLYSSVTGVNGTYGPGFFYDYNGFPNGPGDGNPGNNFGDNNAQDCDPQFCWQLTVSTPASCNPASPPSLDVSVNTLADGESGSWTSLACTDDPLYTVNAIISCCNPPNMASTPVSCPGVSDGSVTATIPGSEPTIDGVYYFSFYDEFGTLVYSTSVDNTGNAGNDVSVTTPSTLSEGDYTVVVSNPVNCAATAIETVAPPAGAVTATVPADVFVCTGNNVGPLVFGVTPATPGYDFDWTMDTDIGAGTSGTGVTQIDAFNASNTGSSIIVSTVTVTPTPIAAGCPGVPETFTITVNPAPIITLTASPGTTVCAGEPVDLEACYTPAPLGVSTSFFEGTDVQIEWTGSGNGPETGTMSVTSTGIEPTTLQPGTLESICFTLSMQDPADIDYFTIEVNGVVYSSNATLPAGSTYNADLNTIFNTINSTPDNGNGQAPPVTVTYCMPQTFLDLIDATGGAANTTWTFFTEFSLSGSNEAFIWDFEVVMLDVTPYNYSWSPTGTITAGSTSGTSFGECHTVTISTPVDETYTFDILDNTGCTGTATVDITVTTGPTATMTSGSAEYCEEDAAATGIDIDVVLTGIPDWTIVYDTDGDLGTTGDQVTVNNISTSPYTITNATAGTYQLVSVTDQGCPGGIVSGTYTVTENPTPTATIGADATVCQNDPSPTITFTGATGTAPYTFTYNINGGGDVTVVSDGTGVATVSAPTGTVGSFTYNLVSVEDANLCSQTQTGSATVVVNPIPTATIDTDVTVCQNDASPTITFTGSNGTAPYTFTYNINGGGDQTAVSDGTGVATISAPTGSAGTFTYNLTAVSDASATACSATLTDAAVVTVNPIPTATIGADATVCQNDPSPTITFTGANGTAPYTFTYNINGGGDVTVVSDGTGVATVSAPTGTAGTFTYNLVSVSDDNLCSQAQTGTATVIVNPTPTATIDTDVTVCQNDASPTITFTGSNGTAPYTFTYNINGGGDQTAVSDGTGVATISAPTGSAGTFTYNLTAVSDASATACSATLTDAAVVTVNPLPTATIGADATVCQNDPSPTITFTGANGTAPYTFTYNINGGANTTVVSDGTGVATVSAPTGTAGSFTYNLVSVSDNSVTACAQPQTGSATVTVDPLPTATIASDVTVCQGDPSPDVTFTGANGTAPYTFTYTINGGANQTVASDGTGVATVAAPTGTAGTFTYDLVSVADNSTNACSQAQTGSAVVTVNPTPTATIATDVTVCVGDASPDITFTGSNGTAPYTFTYNINGGANTTVVSDGTGIATVSAPTGTSGTFTYNLVSVADASATVCTATLTGTAVVTVNPLPTATIATDVTVCVGDASPDITFTGANGTAPYTFTYNINGGANTTVVSDGTGVATVAAPTGTAGTFTYNLVSVADNSATACSQAQTGSATVTVNPTPTATITSDATVCQDDPSVTVTITGSGGTIPYTFSYDINGGATQTLVSDGAGVATLTQVTTTAGTFTYNLTNVADASATACTQVLADAITVTVNPSPTISTVPTDPTVCNGTDGEIEVSGSSANPVTVNWTGPSSGSAAAVTLPYDITGLPAGTYDVTYTDDVTGCSTTISVASLINPGAPVLDIISDVANCDVDYTLPAITGTSLNNPQYYDAPGGAGGGGNIVAVGTTYSATTNITLYAYDENGACFDEEPFTIVINPLPTATIAADVTVCVGDASPNITLTGANGTAPYTFTYNINGGANQTVVSDGTGVATVSAPTGTAGSFAYNLVDVTDASSTACSQAQTGTATVTVNPLPTATIAGDVTVCENDAAPDVTFTGANGTAPYTFTYTVDGGAPQTVVSDGTGVATVSQSTATAGTFTYDLVSVSDATATACSQVQTGTVIITVNPLPTATIAGDVEVCEGSADQVVTITGANGTIPYTFTYTLNGGAPQTLVSDGTGVATITQSAATAGTFTFDLVSVSDASATACSQAQTGTVVVTVNPLPTATIAGTVEVCEGAADQTITFTGANGTAPYTFTYTLNGGAPTTVVSDGTGVATVTQPATTAGTYTYDLVSVEDATATTCTQAQTGSAVVTVNPSPTATIAGDVEVCEGAADQTITFTGANGTAPYTFTYTIDGGAPQTVVSDGTGVATVTQTAGTAGTFTYDLVIVSDASVTACSQAQTGTVLITVNPLPTATIAGDVEVCEGSADQTITLTGANGTAPYTFTYTVNGGAPQTVVSDGTGVATVTQSAATAGTFTFDLVDVTDATATACTQAQTGTAVITVNPLPTATIAGDVTVCEGSADQTVTFTGANGTAPYTFTYTVNGGAPQTVVSDGTGVATVAQSAATAGTFTYDLVSVEDATATACTQVQAGTVLVTVNPLPTASVAGDIEVCEGAVDQTITFTGANGTAPYTFTYTVNGGAPQTVVSDATGVATVTQSAATAGTYAYDLVSVDDANLCSQAQTGTATVTVNPLPTATIAGDVTVCEGSADQTITLTGANGTAPYTFTYTVNGGAPQTVVSDGTGVATVTQVATTAGTYAYDLVDVTDATASACTQLQTGTATVVVNPLPTATISGDVAVCEGSADQTVTFTGAGSTAPYTFTYTVNGGAPQTVVSDGTGVATVTQSASTAGTFTYDLVDVTDASATACTQAQAGTVVVTVNPIPTISTVGTNPTVCNGTDGFVTVSGSSTNNVTVSWAGTTTGTQAGVALPYDITGLGAGTYDVTYVDDVTGCGTTVSQSTLINPGAPILDPIANIVSCADQTLDINSVTGTDLVNPQYYSATGGPTGTGVLIPDGTTFTAFTDTTIYVYDVNGTCSNETQYTITVNTTPTLTLQDTTTCSPNTVDLADVTYWSTDVGTMTWYSDAGLTTALGSTNVGAGTYYVEADNLGCTSNGQVTVTVNTTPTLTVQDTTGCSPFTVDLTDATYWSTDVGTISYFESDGTTPVANATTVGAGTYVLEANNLGCVSTANVVVTEVTTPDVDPLGPIAECDSYTLPVITGTALSGTQAYYTGMNGTGTAYNAGDAITTAGLTTLYIYDGASGCSDEEQLDITITLTPLLTVADPTAVCEPNLVDITGSATSDVGTITFYTDAGLTTPVVDPTQVTAGQYFVEADNNGCASNNSINVIINPLPLAPTAGTDSTYCSSWVLDPMTATGGAGTMTWYDDQNNVLGTGNTYTPDMIVGMTDYYVTETLAGCEGPASLVTITIEECDITIPTAITPNNDMNNDSWEIVNLDAVYPDNVVQIYNRWGNLIFEHISSPSEPYNQNQWDGTYEGNALPVGSYFYVIRLNDEEVATGAVSIILD